MQVNSELIDGVAVVRLHGEVDLAVREELNHVLTEIGQRSAHVVVDLADVTFMDSIGLNALTRLHAHVASRDGWVRLSGPSVPVRHLLTVVGLETTLPVFDDVDSARSA